VHDNALAIPVTPWRVGQEFERKTVDLVSIAAIVAQWAESQPLVIKAWIFGSRVRGTSRQDSDVDVAIEVAALPGDSGPLTTFMFAADDLRRSIQAMLPLKVDLQWYGGPVETPTIHAGLQQSSIVVYPAT
jgi:predicted nucleotidyltransferase